MSSSKPPLLAPEFPSEIGFGATLVSVCGCRVAAFLSGFAGMISGGGAGALGIAGMSIGGVFELVVRLAFDAAGTENWKSLGGGGGKGS